MVAPVLLQELVLDGRRNRQHYLRWLYAGWLLLQWSFLLLGHVAFGAMFRRRTFQYADFADFSNLYLQTFVFQHFLILLLATPTLSAGSITDEKARGTLQYLLITDLCPWEIVAGKLLGRAYHVLVLLLTGLPFVCFFGVFGGLDPMMLFALAVITVLLIFALASASLLASVVCRHTRDAVLGLYVLGGIILVLAFALGQFAGPRWLLDMLDWCNPLYPLGVDWTAVTADELGRRLLLVSLWWGGVGFVCLASASALMRRSYLRFLEGARPKTVRWWRVPRAPVGVNPLSWKERYVEGIAPLAMLRNLPRWLGIVLVVAATIGWSGSILLRHLPAGVTIPQLGRMLVNLELAELVVAFRQMTPANREFFNQGLGVMLVASLVVGIRCSGAITGERERKTWEALLLTPLETRQLLRGKLWGILGACLPYLTAYALPALALSALGGLGAFFWTSLWLGVTILALAYVGSAGLWCSVRAKSSWRSLLSTLGLTYLGGIALYCMTMPVILLLWAILAIIVAFVERWVGVSMLGTFSGWFDAYYLAVCLTLAGAFVFVTWRLLASAEYRVGILERIKHWKDEPRRKRLFPRR